MLKKYEFTSIFFLVFKTWSGLFQGIFRIQSYLEHGRVYNALTTFAKDLHQNSLVGF